MVNIQENDFIAEGLYQKCYRHPKNTNLCVKIEKKDIKQPRLENEINYSIKVSKKKWAKFEYPFYSKCYGAIETNLGKGYVFDLITDEDTHQVSKTMNYYLLNSNHQITDLELQTAFDKLISLMAKHRIIANDLWSTNICCKILKDKSIQLIIIDGLGHRDFLPLVDWFSFFAKKKINRRIIKHGLTDMDTQRKKYLKQ